MRQPVEFADVIGQRSVKRGSGRKTVAADDRIPEPADVVLRPAAQIAPVGDPLLAHECRHPGSIDHLRRRRPDQVLHRWYIGASVHGAMGRMLPVGDAARALGVSVDTLRRWERSGRIATERDTANRRVVDEDEISRLGGHVVYKVDTSFSARNRFEGVITSVEVTGVIAQVEMESGGNHIVSVITRDAVEELGLVPGVRAVATVKATSVMVARL